MTRHDLEIIDTIETTDYMKGELSDEGSSCFKESRQVGMLTIKLELDIPPHMVPPNPDDSDILPSQVHPSYPYGNPTNLRHPAARPRLEFDPTSRALFEDMGYGGAGINGMMRWQELAMDELLPVDEEKEDAKRAEQARKMASGASNNPQPQQQQQQAPQMPQDQTIDEEEEEEEEENNENDSGVDGELEEEESEEEE
ncbi:hypothetical protein H0H92_005694 [Tricholoma furcatifolium]|nr:hypothetical protein H0H92_005694 [Tricholoma furcatifolium]